MSGFVCIWNRDGEPVDGELLQRMTDAMTYRGPDRGGVWMDGAVGMGHRLLITTFEAEREQQPCTLDGSIYIVADARIDDRERLRRELRAKGQQGIEETTDVQLILHAYHAWGEGCVEHLLGDFSFVIWDAREQRIFCARDHWGIKLLYYACVKNTLILSNELKVIRLHPAVSDELNDLAIADFLLFDFNQDVSTTTFADIRRVPPAHTMVLTRADQRQRRYWVLPHDQQVRFKRHQDYIDRFKELLSAAVKDRLRTDNIAVLMSGGLDSPLIAAAAKTELSAKSANYELCAYTYIYEWLIPDDERYYAARAAKTIGIPIKFYPLDDEKLFLEVGDSIRSTPEPFQFPIIDYSPIPLQCIAANGRVVLYGEDGDSLLAPARVPELIRAQGTVPTLQDIISYILRYQRRPPLRTGILARLRGARVKEHTKSHAYPYPHWLNPAFEHRLELPSRWEQKTQPPSVPDKAFRPTAYRRLTSTYLPHSLENLDSSISSFSVEHRLPLFDLRLASYLLALPSLPWGSRKQLLREAGQGILPDEILTRPKTPLAADPAQRRLQRSNDLELPSFTAVPQLHEYVVTDRLPTLQSVQDDVYKLYLTFRPLRLNSWLRAH